MLIARVVPRTGSAEGATAAVSLIRGLETAIARASPLGSGADPRFPEQSGAQACLRRLLPAIESWSGPRHLLMAEIEHDGSVPGRDFIQDLPTSSPQTLPTLDGGVATLENSPRGVVLRDQRSGQIELALWHEPVVQAFRLGEAGSWNSTSNEQVVVEHVTAEAVPGGLYPVTDAGLAVLPAGEWTLDHFLEWREYYGHNSAMVERFVRFTRGVVDGAAGAIGQLGRCVRLGAYGAGVAIAKVVCVARRAAPEVSLGPAIWAELRQAGKEARPDLARLDLRQVEEVEAPKPAQPHPPAVVLVHGTCSSAGTGFEHLDTGGRLFRGRVRLHTFEHDTFQSIGTNAKELATLIRERLHCSRLLMLAHSRGGLVARQATLSLRDHLPGAIEVFTYGTPHEGTALVRDLRSLIRPLAFSGGRVDGALPLPTPRLARLAYLATQMNALPRGLSEMDPESSFLMALNDHPFASARVRTYGGVFDGRASPSAGLAFVGGVADAALPSPNDGVVPLNSALWSSMRPALNGTQIEHCNHFQYFSRGGSLVEAPIDHWIGAALDSVRSGSARPPLPQLSPVPAALQRIRKQRKL